MAEETATPEQPAQTRQQPAWNPQTTRIVVALVVVIAVGVALFFLLHHSSKKAKGNGNGSNGYQAVSAVVLSANQLLNERKVIGGELFYWAGPQTGYSYEFRRTVAGYVFVRYLPSGLRAGAMGNYLVVATYPGYDVTALEGQAKKDHAKVKTGKGGAFYFVDPNRPRTVYMAWQGADVQVELFGSTARQALLLARSGKVVAVHS